MDSLQESYNNIQQVQAVSKEVESQMVTIMAYREKSFQTFKAEDLETWLNGSKLKEYKYFTFRSNNPYIFFFSKQNVQLDQDRVYLTKDLPDFEEVGKEYYEGINEGDVITVYYSNAWWENCLNYKRSK